MSENHETVRIFGVLTMSPTGPENWVVDGFVPDSADPEAVRIDRIYQDSDGWVHVFGTPVKESNPLFGMGIRVKLGPNVLMKIYEASPAPVWKQLQQELSDETVAKFVSQWTGLPEDIIFEHIEEARAEMDEAELEPEDPEPEAKTALTEQAAAPGNGAAS